MAFHGPPSHWSFRGGNPTGSPLLDFAGDVLGCPTGFPIIIFTARSHGISRNTMKPMGFYGNPVGYHAHSRYLP